MLLLENIRLALSAIKSNKMRSLLTMLGIIIGIASVIAIMTVGNSLTTMMAGEMSNMGANNIDVYISRKDVEDEKTEDGLIFKNAEETRSFSQDDLITEEMIREYYTTYQDSIRAISLYNNLGSGSLVVGNRTANVSAMGISLGYLIANNTELISGRFFTNREIDGEKKVCIISDRAAEKLFPDDSENVIGKEVSMEVEDAITELIVVGVYKYVESSFLIGGYGSSSTDVYVPLPTSMGLEHRYNFATFQVITESDVDNEAFLKTTQNFFSGYYRQNQFFTVEAFSMAKMVESMSTMMGSLTAAISVIAGIALLVGGIGVMNIMLVSITERTREIGTRKALGATNRSIRMQFIIEAIIICLIGGMIGMLLGVIGGSLVVKAYLKTMGQPSVKSIIGSLLFSMAIGVFFGYYPANKAAKMDPIEALRYE